MMLIGQRGGPWVLAALLVFTHHFVSPALICSLLMGSFASYELATILLLDHT